MERIVETKFGKITLRGAMIGTDGTNLSDAVEIKLDDELIGEAIGYTFSYVSDMDVEQVEEFVKDHCEI